MAKPSDRCLAAMLVPLTTAPTWRLKYNSFSSWSRQNGHSALSLGHTCTNLKIKERQELIKWKFRKAFFQQCSRFSFFLQKRKINLCVGPLQHGGPVVIIARPPTTGSCVATLGVCKYTPKSVNNSAFCKTTGAYSSQRKEVSRTLTKATVIWQSFVLPADERKRTS